MSKQPSCGKALISVIVPIYNVEKYIAECLNSIVLQTYQNLEIILVDDGSTDRSGDILDEYARKDNRIIVIHKENGGVSAARNDGVAKSSGHYIYIMDSDDYLELDALQMLLGVAERTGADIVMGDHYTFTEDLEQTPHHYFSKEFVTRDKEVLSSIQKMILHFSYSPYKVEGDSALGIAPPWSRLVKSSLIKENNLLFDPYVNGIFDDGLFALEEMQYATSLAYTQRFIYHYRLLSSSLIHKYNPKRLGINKRILKRLQQFIERNKKDKDFQDAVLCRAVMSFVNLLDTYYLNPDFDASFRKKVFLIKRAANRPEYIEAFRNVDINHLTKAQKAVTILIRSRQYELIPLLFYVRKVLSKAKG